MPPWLVRQVLRKSTGTPGGFQYRSGLPSRWWRIHGAAQGAPVPSRHRQQGTLARQQLCQALVEERQVRRVPGYDRVASRKARRWRSPDSRHSRLQRDRWRESGRTGPTLSRQRRLARKHANDGGDHFPSSGSCFPRWSCCWAQQVYVEPGSRTCPVAALAHPPGSSRFHSPRSSALRDAR